MRLASICRSVIQPGSRTFNPIFPESERAAAPGFAGHAAALLLAVLHFLWHQHKIILEFLSCQKGFAMEASAF